MRRFNFFQYADFTTPSLKPLRNPNVTVRSRGVMEKCTYCVQRINAAKINAEKEDRPVRDGEITTACQAACPTQAIVFGNINDRDSRVARPQSGSAELRPLDRTQHQPAHDVSGEAQKSQSGVRLGLAMEPRNRFTSVSCRAKLRVIEPGHSYATLTDKISAIVLTQPTPRLWYVGFALAFALVMLLFFAIAAVVSIGVGLFGIMIPVAWGFDIVNFVWWVGIGHAGTLISAILLLLRQKWRQSINRFAEAMTLFAVACAGLFPLIHLGRPWFAYWLFPYPNTMGIQPQFRSPLIWDVFAVSTYFTVSLLFWYVGLIPDLATLRDRSTKRVVALCLRHARHGLARFGDPLAAL